MKRFGMFEAKTRFSEICREVSETGEPVLITRRRRALVRIEPVIERERMEDVWSRREKWLVKHGPITEELEIPERETPRWKNPLSSK